MLTADEIRAREFLVSLRGYDRDEVHGFLDQIAKDVRDLQTQVETLQTGHYAPMPAEPALAPPLPAVADTNAFFEDLGKTTQRILEAAHEAGSEIQRRARNEADREVAEACSHSGKLIAEGQRRREVIESVVRMLEDRRAALVEDLRGLARVVDQVLADLAPRGALLTPDELVEVAQISAPDTTWVPPDDEPDAAAEIVIDQSEPDAPEQLALDGRDAGKAKRKVCVA
ncbi:MAG: DivIVA domain-containing protein [Egibacteraceae bacterium]